MMPEPFPTMDCGQVEEMEMNDVHYAPVCGLRRCLELCGLCEDPPCKDFIQLRDPNTGEEEFQSSPDRRKRELKQRADTGTREWLKMKFTQ